MVGQDFISNLVSQVYITVQREIETVLSFGSDSNAKQRAPTTLKGIERATAFINNDFCIVAFGSKLVQTEALVS